ncbi:hypothetical protein [uncultured Clostridium sp.]|uniref:hypothetical protein n=1 Tax=uncultured Clostridium sp. TaxID=59620 RepID=UPI00261566D3|nr:hypothetical protein [uncultured Clostridium sp.]
MKYVESYIDVYELVKETENLPEEKKADSKRRTVIKTMYNRTTTTTYTEKYINIGRCYA